MENIKAKSFFSRAALGLVIGGTAVFAACGTDDGAPIGQNTSPGAGGAEEGDGTCGGFLGTACHAGKYCDFEVGNCGYADGLGQCQPIPSSCPEECTKVCGCDGLVYCNACMAHLAGVDDSTDTTCEGTPPTAN